MSERITMNSIERILNLLLCIRFIYIMVGCVAHLEYDRGILKAKTGVYMRHGGKAVGHNREQLQLYVRLVFYLPIDKNNDTMHKRLSI